MSARVLEPVKSRRNHPGVIDDQQVTGAKDRCNRGEGLVAQSCGLPVEDEQARSVTSRQGRLGDQRFRQFEVEIAQLHNR